MISIDDLLDMITGEAVDNSRNSSNSDFEMIYSLYVVEREDGGYDWYEYRN